MRPLSHQPFLTPALSQAPAVLQGQIHSPAWGRDFPSMGAQVKQRASLIVGKLLYLFIYLVHGSWCEGENYSCYREG